MTPVSIFAWLVFAAFFIGKGLVALRAMNGANDFPGTEAGLAGCFLTLTFGIGSILLSSFACWTTFEGGGLIWSLVACVASGLASTWGIFYLSRLDYEAKTMASWNKMTAKEQADALRFKPRYFHLKPRDPSQ